MAFLKSMKRLVHLSAALLFSAIILPQVSYAQNVKMRTGVHADYSRLVVEWPTKTNVSVSKQGANLNVLFDQAASPQTGQVNIDQTRNITDLTIVKKDPLTLSVSIPEQSRHRHFYAGNRFVLDIYNAPGSNPVAKPKIQAKAPAKPEEKQKPQTQPVKEVMKQAKAAKVETVEKETLLDNNFAKVKNINPVSANLIALSSAKSFGLAVFERGDKVYIVNDDPNLLISPKVNGPDSQYLVPLESIEQEDAKIFRANNLIGSYLRTQGGGLLWKIIISGSKNKLKPIEPIRQNVQEGALHSGRLLIPFKEPNRLIEFKDPVTGQMLKIVTSKTSTDFTGPRRSFPEFELLSSAAGLVVLPRVDDLFVKVKSYGVEISRPGGLAILAQDRVAMSKSVKKRASPKLKTNARRIYDFKNWQLGGVDALRTNKNILLANAAQLPKAERDDALMTLAKMYLANAMGAEALGFLYMVQNYNPEIVKTPEFLALRGAAHAIDNKMENAFNDLSIEDLEQFEELGFWKAYALAEIGDWQQAIETLPKSAAILYEYPELILNRLGLVSAEVALRAGQVDLAKDILTIIHDEPGALTDEQVAALKYLQGEAARQSDDLDKAMKEWKPLTTGRDDLYRAKAGLALTRLKVEEGKIETEDAINALERLRYAWRGDELEARVGYWLGRTYFEGGQFVKGLNLMRESATVAAGTNLGDRITNEMSEIFTGLYMGDALDKVSPLDAVALYEQFSELVPTGDAGDKIVERLADRLTAADLLGRAGNLLSYQLRHRLNGIDAYNAAVKLAAIYLLDSKPADALKVLDTAQTKFDGLPEEMKTADKVQDMTLLRARALSRNGRPDQGIAMLENLNNNPSTNHLRADIAWTAGYWDDAAAALGDVIIDKNISLTRPLSDENTQLILHRAISLNLAADRIGLANMREKYTDAMASTNKARIFEVITRPRQNPTLADRDTLMGIVSEVDLFSDFLESYKTVSKPSN